MNKKSRILKFGTKLRKSYSAESICQLDLVNFNTSILTFKLD